MQSVWDSLIALDVEVLILINSKATHPFFDFFFPKVTDLHKQVSFIFPVILLFFYLFQKTYSLKKGSLLFFGLILNLAVTDFTGSQWIKTNVGRLRPADAKVSPLIVRSPFGGKSFISNHAANTMAFANYCGYFLPQTKIVTLLISMIIAYSRVYNGVHYPGDVLGGMVWGLFISLTFIHFARRFILEKGKRES